ncbi:MAG TPA: hypothetical protein VJH87_07015 [Vicinamibacteria bacterium]|nr:hypothetical protein [Vicinamibacteria bacterium]
MQTAVGVLLLALSAAAFFFRLRRGLYSRFPYEQFLLVGAAFALGLLAAIANPGAVTLALLAVEIGALALVVRYLGIGARFPADEVKVKAGERFPDFVLPDSEGGSFHSRSPLGSSAALYIFYRGHF